MNRTRFISTIRKRLPLRLHMTLILMATSLAGVGASKLLLVSGVSNVALRFPLTVVLAYLVFLGLVKLWLFLISEAPARRFVENVGDALSPDISLPDLSGTVSPSFSGGGGSFGGGGASDSFADAVPEGVKDAAGAVGDAVGDVVGGALDDEGGLALVVVLGVLALLLFSVLGGAAYLVWEAPAILSEAAFDALLAASLVKSSRKLNEPDWLGSVFTATWKPFALILAFSLLAGWAMHHYLPRAERVADVIRMVTQ
jgi:hypothetical protein